MTQSGYALIGLTAMVAVLVAVITFALLRFVAAARDTRRHLHAGSAETAFLSAALQEAVTKLKAQERAMSARAAASEQLSGQIVASLTAGLLVVDREGRVEILNPAGTRLLGLPGDARGASYRELLAPAPPLADVIAECLATGKAVLRRTIEMPAGMPATHLGVTVSPLGTGNLEPGGTGTLEPAGTRTPEPGPRNGAICLFADLTNVVELEEQLRLKETLARLGELTAGIAHEFRNGLATIHGYSRLMDPQQLPPQYRPYVEAIRQETEALGKVVTNFLNFAKPDQVTFSRVDLGALVNRAVEEARHDLPQADVSVRGEFGSVEGDDVLLRQMIVNLIRNGVEAASGVAARPSVLIEGRVNGHGGSSSLVVHDNGPGIEPGARERVFRPFFTTKSHGTGLGLAIVQKVVVTHNGRIAIGSSPLGGASFEITFP
jgi:nitrogen fixation/metabolism regulation signal transduction histidine kinase